MHYYGRMTDTDKEKKRIAQNTLILYFRMLFMMLVMLYTNRVILDTLGVDDYGIYNVVGGIVVLFSMLSGSLSAAISRFITYEIGTGNQEKLSKIFSSAVTIQIGLSVLVVLLAETLGVWFLNAKMNIPEDRMIAANWVFQFSIVTFAINLISVPYNACIIAHERMAAFAYISIFETLGKLGIAFLIMVSPIDKLVFYSLLMCVLALVVRFIYGVYCKRQFDECTYHYVFDKSLLGRMFGFAGWNFIGATSAVLRDQGGNIVINLFCGPAVNAARAIASQVAIAVGSFVSSFMTALNPQITKSYAAGERAYMLTLIFQGSRLSFYMLMILSLPVIINTPYILGLWLVSVPEHAVLFVQLALLFSMSESLSNPLVTAMLATGNIRNYQIVVGGLQLLNLPISYLLLRFGAIPEMVLVVAVAISQCCLVARLYMLRGMIGISMRKYLRKVYANVLSVSAIAVIVPVCVVLCTGSSLLSFLGVTVLSLCCSAMSILFVGCNANERNFVFVRVRRMVANNPLLRKVNG